MLKKEKRERLLRVITYALSRNKTKERPEPTVYLTLRIYKSFWLSLPYSVYSEAIITKGTLAHWQQ